jgi:Fe-S-cluster containining protein
MVLGFLAALFGARNRLPRDQVTRVPRAAKKAAAEAIEGMSSALTKIGALPGIADIKDHKRLPRGFYALVESFVQHAEAYQAIARKHLPIAEDVKRPGEPGGTGDCYPAPLGVSTIEALNIYRTIRPWRDFQDVAKRLAELGEQQFKDIQAGHSGKSPEKIRMGGRAVREGRIAFAKRMEPCPFLDQKRDRCRIWEQRPLVCRMHYPTTPPELSRPDHEAWPIAVKAKNIRLPVKVQVQLAQLDKRMMLQISPFMYAGVLQLLQLSEGQPIQEVGEAPQRMQQDGQVAQKANRNVKHAAKFKKKKKKK